MAIVKWMPRLSDNIGDLPTLKIGSLDAQCEPIKQYCQNTF